MANILTTARESVWDAIENWSGLQDAGGNSVFQRMYKFDEDDSPEVNPRPGAGELPAIAVFPDPGMTVQVKNRDYEHGYRLLALIFTETWNLTTSDLYWEQLIKALWQSAAGGVPYVKAAVGLYPKNDVTIDVDRIKLDGKKALLTTVGFTLPVRFDPQGIT